MLRSLAMIPQCFEHICRRSQVDSIKKEWRARFGALPADTTLTIQSFWPRNLGVPSDEPPKAIEWILVAADTVQQSV